MTTSPFYHSNIKTDWGAVGDGFHDDTSAFQNAFNNVWTTFAGTRLYIPTGRYLITSPLLCRGTGSDNTSGAQMYGEGMRNSVLVFNPTTSGNSFGLFDGGVETPCIYQTGQSFQVFTRFGIQGPGTDSTPVSDDTIGGVYSTNSGPGTTSQNYFIDMAFDDLAFGVLATTNGNCENFVFENCWFDHLSTWGIRPVGQNTLNWTVLGGGFSNCAVLTTLDIQGGTKGNGAAAISVEGGGVQYIKNARFVNNTVDIFNDGTQGMSVIGGSSTSPLFYGPTSGFPFVLYGVTYAPPTSVIGGVPTRFIDGSYGVFQGLISACRYAPQSDTGVGYIYDGGTRSGVGDVMFNGLIVGPNGGSGQIRGLGRISLIGNDWGSPKNPSLFTNFTGTKVLHPDGD